MGKVTKAAGGSSVLRRDEKVPFRRTRVDGPLESLHIFHVRIAFRQQPFLLDQELLPLDQFAGGAAVSASLSMLALSYPWVSVFTSTL